MQIPTYWNEFLVEAAWFFIIMALTNIFQCIWGFDTIGYILTYFVIFLVVNLLIRKTYK
jgi:hypothetical protein